MARFKTRNPEEVEICEAISKLNDEQKEKVKKYLLKFKTK